MRTELEILEFMRDTAYKPMTYQELGEQLHITDKQELKVLLKVLMELEQEGSIYRNRNDRYGVPERMNLIRGRLQAHAKGFGFLIPEDKSQVDVYIHANDLHGAMNNDTLFVRITGKSNTGKQEGEVVRIITRANTQIVGIVESTEHYTFVHADDKRISKDIFIPTKSMMGAVNGQKVVVQIVHYPEDVRAAAEGEIVEILGHKDDPGVDILSIIRKHQLPESFPDEVNEEANSAPDSISEEEMQDRRDLRHTRTVTIDGEDAKDLDDAVQVERLDNGNIMLRVSIADVGYYVREKSRLDEEAYNRGCSVYLVDRVIPMLPHRLSNGICSLNPQVDRLTLTCEMEIDDQAKVVNHDIYSSVIRTVERMTYTNVRKILVDRDPELMERYRDLVADFELMNELSKRLRQGRMGRGAIDFDFPEAKILVDENGKPYDIVKRDRSVAEMLIEEFMLKANETVAEHFYLLKVPFLYRIHEDPDSEKLMRFIEFAANFGYVIRGVKGAKVHPQTLQKLLDEIKGTKEETVISTVMLRSMKQAKYDAENTGHFGLAAQFYSHFTSPIRRYPDLVIHRVIREILLNGRLSDKRHEYLAERMVDIAKQSSERERTAVEAERDTDNLKKAEYMLDKIGEEFDGIISSVTSFGMFVELTNTVEGLIRLSDLTDDYYNHHELQHSLIGERTSKVFRLGDEVKVRVARVNMDDHTIDFEMVDMKPRDKSLSVVGGFSGRNRGEKYMNAADAKKGKSARRSGKDGKVGSPFAGKSNKAEVGSRKKNRGAGAGAGGKNEAAGGVRNGVARSDSPKKGAPNVDVNGNANSRAADPVGTAVMLKKKKKRFFKKKP
ncbi:MAG: ribonuclease R [Paenibacillaceae bacterium]